MRILVRSIVVAALGFALVLTTTAQQERATLEFSVQATPSGGRPQRVMRQLFYLLRASLAEIEKQARQQTPAPELDAFVDELKVSSELKAWMKKHRSVTLQGPDFLASLDPEAVLEVPEFREAYVTRNLVMVGLGFPKRKPEKDPAKREEVERRYWEAVRNYLVAHPESKEGMDEHLLDITAAAEWRARTARHEEQVQQKALQLVHARYLVAQAETDYEGFARLGNLPAGRYWLTTLRNEVRAGDVHLHWEVPVELQPGQTLYLELNNANASPAHPR